MSVESVGFGSATARLREISRRVATAVGLIAAGMIVGALTGKISLAVTVMSLAGALALWLCFLRPDVALSLFFCGIIMTSDAVSLSAPGSFVIPDMDIIQGLPSALTSFFIVLFGITMMRTFFFERRAVPVSLTGLGLYAAVVLLALLTGLYNHNNAVLMRVDLINMLFPVLCFYLCVTILHSRALIKQLLVVLFCVTTLKATILAAYFLAGRGWLYALDGETPDYIVTLDSADLLFCITFMLIAVHLIVRGGIRGIRAGAVLAACVPMLFAVIFSYRRAQWIGLVCSLGLLFLGAVAGVRRRFVVLFLIALCAGLFVLLLARDSRELMPQITARVLSLFDEDQSSNLHHKLESIQVMETLEKNPLLGLGLGGQHGGFVEVEFSGIPTNIVHQTFLYIWMKMGLPGLAFFGWMGVRYGKRILWMRKTHLNCSDWGLVLPLAASSGLWLAMFLTSPIPWYMHQTFFKALVAAVVVSLILQAERELAENEGVPL